MLDSKNVILSDLKHKYLEILNIKIFERELVYGIKIDGKGNFESFKLKLLENNKSNNEETKEFHP